MRETRAGKTKTSRRRKGTATRKPRQETQPHEKVQPNRPLLVFDQGEHLQGLWVTLGLADVAD